MYKYYVGGLYIVGVCTSYLPWSQRKEKSSDRQRQGTLQLPVKSVRLVDRYYTIDTDKRTYIKYNIVLELSTCYYYTI